MSRWFEHWLPLVIAIIGLVGTVGGTLLGAYLTERRAENRERARREYEDQIRNFEKRRDAYTTYANEWSRIDKIIWQDTTLTRRRKEDPLTYVLELDGYLNLVRIYGSVEVAAFAERMYDALFRGDEDRLERFKEFGVRMRSDLGIPDGSIAKTDHRID